MEPDGRTAGAVAIGNGRILAVGSTSEVEAYAGAGTRRRDLEGGALLPAFTDTHMHLEKIAAEMMMVHLESAQTMDELLAAVAAVADATPPGEWVHSFGDDNAWHERQLRERRLPTREELDRVCSQQPLFLLRGPDVAALNSLAVAELEPLMSGADDMSLERDLGLLSGTDIRLLQGDLPGPSLDRRQEILQQACRKLLSFGITAVVDPGLPARFAESWQLYQEARARGSLPLRVELMNRLDYRLPFEDEYARVQREEVTPHTGDDYLRVFGVKLILDGEFLNAWVRPGEAARVEPEARYSIDEIDRMLDLCARRGWPLCIHVMGGGAIDAVIERVDAAAARGSRFFPWQLSLAHVFLPSPDNLVDLRRLGIAVSVHPLLVYVFETEIIDAWGELAQLTNPYASMRAAGLFPAGGSDVLPCEPLRGAQLAVTRRARNGAVFGAPESLSARAALELFTSAAGPYMRRFDRGRIAPGFVADVVAWSADPLSVDPEEWLQLQTQFVAVAGDVIDD